MAPEKTSALGVALQLPDGWEDNSILRFTAPLDASDPLVSSGLSTNMVVTAHAVPKSIPLTQVFDAPNRAHQSQSSGFTVVQFGPCLYLNQPAMYQDVTFSDKRVQSLIAQRQVAVRSSDGRVVIVTLTADKKQFAKAVAELPIDVKPAVK